MASDPVFEVRSRITHRSLMNKTKHELASQVLELLEQVDKGNAMQEARAKAAEDALLCLTPGGSEYFRKNWISRGPEFIPDVPTCLEYILLQRRRMQDRLAEAMRRMKVIKASAYDEAITAAKVAAWRARFGAPSGWQDPDAPRGWHLARPCTPTDASMHDNGCVDAAREISALVNLYKEKTHA